MSNIMDAGLAMGISGLAIALLAYPVYRFITGNRKRKYADQILRLSDELMK